MRRGLIRRAARSPWVGHLTLTVIFLAAVLRLLGYAELGHGFGGLGMAGAVFLAGRAIGREDGVERGREIGRLEERLRQGRQTP